ncbi:MAG: tRNA uridine-5-carboxymethylaminomethyl(34) synthesis GTPase MnmE [Bacteroidota bacterium]
MAFYEPDTIFSLATPNGTGAIGVIRISGKHAIEIVSSIFKGKTLTVPTKQQVFFGSIYYESEIIDEVILTVFRAPHSFTKEDTVEISCHNSRYIVHRILELLQRQTLYARLAKPGEFTQRAFLNGRFDLAQAEAIADLIASDTKASHHSALNQMRGGFSKDIQLLRQKLIEFAALLELELDFGEEDVEFADRNDLKKLIDEIQQTLLPLIQSFQLGNSLKDGIPTVIAGKPNVGKSTLLNTLLNEERAIVSDIPGTTRDLIEDEIILEGIKFRIVDTAGLRETKDTIEAIGVERTQQKMKKASIILYVFDATIISLIELKTYLLELDSLSIPYLLIGNKLDVLEIEKKVAIESIANVIWISASKKQHIDSLKQAMLQQVQATNFIAGNTIITNIRHYEHLHQTYEALKKVLDKINRHVTSDWLALDIRDALNHLGAITGEITNDDLLATIFSKFCIGK